MHAPLNIYNIPYLIAVGSGPGAYLHNAVHNRMFEALGPLLEQSAGSAGALQSGHLAV